MAVKSSFRYGNGQVPYFQHFIPFQQPDELVLLEIFLRALGLLLRLLHHIQQHFKSLQLPTRLLVKIVITMP